ncbi:hypothetical protein HY640_00485 [Candidatus Woesearchaeota archaeon]|nr:hypothetical protein [Candidatus Woesearchaeota archaeon]
MLRIDPSQRFLGLKSTLEAVVGEHGLGLKVVYETFADKEGCYPDYQAPALQITSKRNPLLQYIRGPKTVAQLTPGYSASSGHCETGTIHVTAKHPREAYGELMRRIELIGQKKGYSALIETR